LYEPKINTKKVSLIRVSTWLVLTWEKLWPLLVPVFMAVCAYMIFSWAGGWRLLDTDETPALLWIARILFGLVLLCALWPLRLFQRPEEQEITRRIELKSELEHRPITAQDDKMAMGDRDGFAEILWQEHKSRMSGQLENMTAGAPSPEANRFDPFAVRALLPVLAFAAFFFSFSSVGGKLSDSYLRQENTAELLTRMDAWINPPAYTQKPPVYLSLNQGEAAIKSLTVPKGSEFFLRIIGDNDVSLLKGEETNSVALEPEQSEKGAEEIEYKFILEEDSVLRLTYSNKELAQWGIAILEDKAPEIAFLDQPRAALSGSLELGYTVKDDYGVVSARAIIKSLEDADPNARPLIEAPEVDLPLPRFRAKKGVSKANRDLTQHPWAGSQVSIQLEATDDAKQTGVTEVRQITMPGRRFSKPLALAIVEQRRILALDANKQNYVANLLDAVSSAPPEFIDNPNATLAMRVAYRRIVDAQNDDDLRSSLDLLWEIALAVEFGDLSEAEKNLREAQEKLSEALENGASDEEIERLMQELRQAMNEMLQALAEEARQNPQAQNPFDQNDAQTMTQNDLERMMNQIEDLAKSGSKDAARQMLSEMQRMMDNMRAGQHQQQRQAEGNELNQSLDQLSELMQQQQRLMEESFRMQRQQEQGLRPNNDPNSQNNQQGQQQQQGEQQQGQQQGQQRQQQGQRNGNQSGQQEGQQSQQGQGGQMTQEEFAQALEALRQQQEALQKQLGELGQKLEELGLGQSQELQEAQREMGQAGENLGEGNAGEAATDQGQALEALRQGAQNMMQQMAGDRQQGGQQQSEQNGQGQSASQRRGSDPLGRQEGEGLNSDSDVQVPGEIDAQRARRILEAIRDRLAIPDNPIIEKDYLERLLKSE
jgi:uncharacterized protein (TIGR02302 family)